MKKTIAVHWQYGTSTHSGWYRGDNEDRSLLRIGTAGEGDAYAFAVIADGMGGYGTGTEASETALSVIRQWMDERLPDVLSQDATLEQVDKELAHVIDRINRQLLQMGSERNTRLGTTFTVLLLHKEHYLVHHVGDCRVYYLKPGGALKLLTEDHTWVSEQVRLGRLTNAQAAKHPKRHVLLQCLGVQQEPAIYRKRGFYDPYSLFLLCSDGLYHRYTDDELRRFYAHMVSRQIELQAMADALVEKALDRGADDNLTLMMIRPTTAYSTAKERRLRDRAIFYNETLPENGRKMLNHFKQWVNGFKR